MDPELQENFNPSWPLLSGSFPTIETLDRLLTGKGRGEMRRVFLPGPNRPCLDIVRREDGIRARIADRSAEFSLFDLDGKGKERCSWDIRVQGDDWLVVQSPSTRNLRTYIDDALASPIAFREPRDHFAILFPRERAQCLRALEEWQAWEAENINARGTGTLQRGLLIGKEPDSLYPGLRPLFEANGVDLIVTADDQGTPMYRLVAKAPGYRISRFARKLQSLGWETYVAPTDLIRSFARGLFSSHPLQGGVRMGISDVENLLKWHPAMYPVLRHETIHARHHIRCFRKGIVGLFQGSQCGCSEDESFGHYMWFEEMLTASDGIYASSKMFELPSEMANRYALPRLRGEVANLLRAAKVAQASSEFAHSAFQSAPDFKSGHVPKTSREVHFALGKYDLGLTLENASHSPRLILEMRISCGGEEFTLWFGGRAAKLYRNWLSTGPLRALSRGSAMNAILPLLHAKTTRVRDAASYIARESEWILDMCENLQSKNLCEWWTGEEPPLYTPSDYQPIVWRSLALTREIKHRD